MSTTPEFIKQAKSCMDEENHKDFIHYIAGNPLDGNLIEGTGGVRKIRWFQINTVEKVAG